MNLAAVNTTEKISCKNQLLEEVLEKSQKVEVSFRQISHLDSSVSDGFTFFLAAFANSGLRKSSYTLTINITVLIGEVKKEKEAKCSLRKDVAAQKQASFDCKVELSRDEKRQIKFDDPEAIKISTDNPDIGGISKDEILSPLKTDKAIEEAKVLRAKGILTELGDCIDYSLEENIVKEPPPSFEIISLISRNVKRQGKETVEKCQNGKLSFKGKFSKKIDQEITFDLPLSFPQSLIKCTVNKAEKDEEVEVSCKAPKFQKVNSFVIEPRLIKKKHQEVLFVKQKKLEFQEFGCEDYSTLKYKRAVDRQKAPFSYLQLSDFKPSKGNIFEFFFACIKTEISNNFNLQPFDVHIKKKEKKYFKKFGRCRN
jgi:hypothetical protein